jgi:hypothetical protein
LHLRSTKLLHLRSCSLKASKSTRSTYKVTLPVVH